SNLARSWSWAEIICRLARRWWRAPPWRPKSLSRRAGRRSSRLKSVAAKTRAARSAIGRGSRFCAPPRFLPTGRNQPNRRSPESSAAARRPERPPGLRRPTLRKPPPRRVERRRRSLASREPKERRKRRSPRLKDHQRARKGEDKDIVR